MVLLLAQGLAVFIFLHALLGRVYGTRSFSWDLLNHESERARSLTVCDSLRISITPLSNYGDIGRAPYTLLALEAGGVLTVTQVHEDGLWQVKHRRGSRLLLALLDSSGKSGGILPTIFTVASGPSDCIPTLPTAEDMPTVTANVTRTEPCDFWHLYITGGVPPYTVILASPGTPIPRHLTALQGSSTFSFINNAIKLRGPTLASVRDSFGQTADFTETMDASGVPCKVKRLEEQVGQSVLVAQSSDGVKMSQRDTTIVAACASIGGTMILAALCFAVVILRRRKRGLVAGQDARPRPFDVVVPAPSINTSAPRVNVSVPLSVIDISWRNNWMASPTDASSTRSPVGPSPSPSRTHVRPLPVPATSRQSSHTSLRSPEDPRSGPPRKPSNSSMHTTRSPQAGPSSRHPRPQQSNSSMRSANNSHHHTNIYLPVQRSILAQEGQLSKPRVRSERHKHLLHPSRSTGDIHDDNVAPSHRQHGTMPRSRSNAHKSNQLRHYYSASNITHAERRAPELMTVHQHRHRVDPPPPYHKL